MIGAEFVIPADRGTHFPQSINHYVNSAFQTINHPVNRRFPAPNAQSSPKIAGRSRNPSVSAAQTDSSVQMVKWNFNFSVASQFVRVFALLKAENGPHFDSEFRDHRAH
jgi:hypothetical protein